MVQLYSNLCTFIQTLDEAESPFIFPYKIFNIFYIVRYIDQFKPHER